MYAVRVFKSDKERNLEATPPVHYCVTSDESTC